MIAADGRPSLDHALLLAKADQLDRMIVKRRAMSKDLRHAAVCRAPSHMEEYPTFQKLLKAAARGTLKAPRGKER